MRGCNQRVACGLRRIWLGLALLCLTPPLWAASAAELVSQVRVPTGGSSGRPLYVALHGLGSDEQDLLSLASALPPDVTLASLRAPLELAPGHYAWFSPQPAGQPLAPDPHQLHASEQAIERTVTALLQRYHADPQHVVVFGFSQGAIMAYDLGLADPQRFHQLGIFSGARVDTIRQRLGQRPLAPAVKLFIGHGLDDPRIPVARAREAAEWWQQRGAKVELHLYPGLQHGIDPQELADFAHWLQQA